MQGMHHDVTVYSRQDANKIVIDGMTGQEHTNDIFTIVSKSSKTTNSIGVLRWKTLDVYVAEDPESSDQLRVDEKTPRLEGAVQ